MLMKMPTDKRFVDLTCKRFGMLTVLFYDGKNDNGKHKWMCQCDCKNTKSIRGHDLKSGNTRSCGCGRSQISKSQLLDLTGMVFGKLSIIKYAGVSKMFRGGKRNHVWLCQCDCGSEVTVSGDSLRSGNTQSCGCYQKEKVRERIIDLTGKKFDKLTVVKYVCHKWHQPCWECICECGNTTVVPGNNLKSGKTKSCGCKQGNFIHGMSGKPGYKKMYLSDPLKKVRHIVGVAVRKALRTRNLSKNGGQTFQHLPYTPQQLKEHLESLWEPWMTWSNYGGRNNDKRKTWHIDHIVSQSKFPYTSLEDPLFAKCWALKNLRPMEKIANIKKGGR